MNKQKITINPSQMNCATRSGWYFIFVVYKSITSTRAPS